MHSLNVDMSTQLNLNPDWQRNDLNPDWRAQVNRCIVPCQNADTYEWLRKGPVATLGELFKHLGIVQTAKAIYALFRTCRLVALKRKKDSRKRTAPPGSAITGVTGSPLQAASIRSEYTRATHGDALVEEYIQVKGLNAAYVEEKGKQRVLQEAVQFIQMVLLTDLRPPWLAHEFPQALPEGGVLSRSTRP